MSKRKLDSIALEAHQPSKRLKAHPGDTSHHPEEAPRATIAASTSAMEMEVDPTTRPHSSQSTSPRETTKRAREEEEEDSSGNNDGQLSKPPPQPQHKHKVRKLVPPRPFPTVPASVSATGPRSAHTEGKNYICITRRTELGAYLRRCKDVFLKDGYKTLHLSAMGAAIPHLMQLALSLPGMLPFPADEVRTEVTTGSVEVQDEVIPDDDDEDVAYRTRGKSTVSVVITVGDGVDEPPPAGIAGKGGGRKNKLGKGRGPAASSGKQKGYGKRGQKGGGT
ncbi:hypothetical protein GSI_05339 [Ganoderma sinense ZZ0214-1]|uniref:Uncharacterized protein n=1 Tax=Ganoderma sinense ZZ0214-1 TaxID=1077348 RepID=A0A2G8SFT1_9APHY|nr:hypothetical protein GSI_05339 [Ganoderma sinense ZZ0214-1]